MPVAARQQGCVTYHDLLDAGWSRHAIAHRATTGRLERLHRQVYRVIDGAHYPFTREMAAALAYGPEAMVGLLSAGKVFGALEEDDGVVDIILPGACRRSRDGIRVHRATALAAEDTGHIHGVPITSPERTLLDIASVLKGDDLAWAVNEALVRELTTAEEIRALLKRTRGHRGTAALTSLIAENPAADKSKLNRLTHEALRRGGVPEPEREVHIAGWKVDFFWPDRNLVLEADGLKFHRHVQSIKRDRRKQSDLELLGHRVLRTDWDEVTLRPEAMVGRVLLARAA